MTLLRYESAVSPGLVAFPWHSLPVVRGEDISLERDARRAAAELIDLTRVREVLSQLFLASLDDFGVRSSKVSSERRDLGLQFTLRCDEVSVWLSLEPELCVMLLKRVLGQREGLDAGGPLSQAMTGAAHAILTEVCRRVARGPMLRPDFTLQQGPSGDVELCGSPGQHRAWVVDFFVRIDGRSYAGFVAIAGTLGAPLGALTRTPRGALLTPLRLTVVVGRCELSRNDFESLMVGDVLIPGDPTFEALVQAEDQNLPNGATVILCSPGATAGLKLMAREAKLCLDSVTPLCYDSSVTTKPPVKNPIAAHSADAEPTALDVVMQAPVVVHIEMGAVTLPAHTWLNLRPGDVVTSQLPIGSPVTLRVAEQAVADGELVNVDGQVGVRILRFHSA